MTQEESLNILKTGANVFLTGEPGSGKTHTVNAYVRFLRERGVEPAITASTGIAATHIGGFTIHSWSGIGIRRMLSAYDLDLIAQNKRVVSRVSTARILIIDEVSMLSAQTFAMVDAVCREIRRDTNPFGGLQVILVGDFFQLPPISRRDGYDRGKIQEAMQEKIFVEQAKPQFAFSSSAWNTLNPVVCYLSEQHRQDDGAFLEFLSAIRSGAVSERHRVLLSSRFAASVKNDTTELYSHNIDVDRINERELSKLPGGAALFSMESRGPENFVLALKRGCLSPETLSLKVGARVMFTKNDVMAHKYANGTLGIVVGFSKETGSPLVKTNGGRTVSAEPEEWSFQDGGKILARLIQIPLRLAWAITVHKSQGMSLDGAHMDLSDTFEYGQGYVALSRVRTLQGLTIAGFNERALQVHPEILEKDDNFQTQSKEARNAFSEISSAELQKMHTNFIRACGGSIAPVKRTREKFQKISTLEATKQLLLRKLSLAEIATSRGMAESTIATHLEELSAQKKISSPDLLHLRAGKEETLWKIHEALRVVGAERLKPVFDYLGGRIPYETIRLARLLFEG